jgi:hypothetical protein
MFTCPGRCAWQNRPGPNILNAGSLPAVNLPQPGNTFTLFLGRDSRTRGLALAELEALAGALLPVFFAFLHARIARQKTVLAQTRAQLRIENRQRAG